MFCCLYLPFATQVSLCFCVDSCCANVTEVSVYYLLCKWHCVGYVCICYLLYKWHCGVCLYYYLLCKCGCGVSLYLLFTIHVSLCACVDVCCGCFTGWGIRTCLHWSRSTPCTQHWVTRSSRWWRWTASRPPSCCWTTWTRFRSVASHLLCISHLSLLLHLLLRLWTLHLLACWVKVAIEDSGLCCCGYVMSFKGKVTNSLSLWSLYLHSSWYSCPGCVGVKDQVTYCTGFLREVWNACAS